MHQHIHCTLSLIMSAESSESLYHRLPLGCRGSTCVELMTTLYGSASSLRRRVGGCVPLEGTIAPARDPFKRPTHPCLFRATIDLLG